MRMKTRRTLAVLLSAVLLLCIAPAGYAVDVTTPCSITVEPASKDAKHENGTLYMDDLKSADIVFDLYRIAAAKEDTQFDTYDYTLAEPFKTLKMGKAEDRNASFWQKLAQDAAKIALNVEVTAEETVSIKGKPAAAAPEGSKLGQKQAIPAVDGVAAGLYLIVVRSSEYKRDSQSDYVFVKGGEIATMAHSAAWNYFFTPQLISIPTKDAVKDPATGEDVINTANPGEWIFEPTVIMKPTAESRAAKLTIKKSLESLLDLSKDTEYVEPATFTFDIIARETEKTDSKVLLRKQITINFDASGTKEETVEGIPIGSFVWVEEVYEGAHYHSSTNEKFPIEIKAPAGGNSSADVTVSFTNTDTTTHRGGHGIENEFTYDGKTWAWSTDPGGTHKAGEVVES